MSAHPAVFTASALGVLAAVLFFMRVSTPTAPRQPTVAERIRQDAALAVAAEKAEALGEDLSHVVCRISEGNEEWRSWLASGVEWLNELDTVVRDPARCGEYWAV